MFCYFILPEVYRYLFMQAASKSRSEVCSLLLSHGADPTLLNCHSKSALGTAIFVVSTTLSLNVEKLKTGLVPLV